jgi:hypothetical protein
MIFGNFKTYPEASLLISSIAVSNSQTRAKPGEEKPHHRPRKRNVSRLSMLSSPDQERRGLSCTVKERIVKMRYINQTKKKKKKKNMSLAAPGFDPGTSLCRVSNCCV